MRRYDVRREVLMKRWAKCTAVWHAAGTVRNGFTGGASNSGPDTQVVTDMHCPELDSVKKAVDPKWEVEESAPPGVMRFRYDAQ